MYSFFTLPQKKYYLFVITIQLFLLFEHVDNLSWYIFSVCICAVIFFVTCICISCLFKNSNENGLSFFLKNINQIFIGELQPTHTLILALEQERPELALL